MIKKKENENKYKINKLFILFLIAISISIIIYFMQNKVTTCYKQETCWKNTLCDMTCEYGKSHNQISCVNCASYCDMKSNICRCTKISYPNLNPIVDWNNFHSKC